MKKERVLTLLLSFVLVIGIVPMLSVAEDQGPSEHAKEMTLYAGQDMEVGTVIVWNDAEYIYVRYEIDQDLTEDNWYLTEVHVHVGEELDDFPLAGRWGNPIPGRFDHKEYFESEDEVTTHTVVIELDWEVDDEILIAAHAALERIDYTEAEETLYLSNGGTTDQNGLYNITLEGNHANLTEIFDFSDYENFDFVTHIGASPDGNTVYAVAEDTGHLGAYSVSDGTFEDLGYIEDYPSDVVQVALSPEGQLYMTSKGTDSLYTVDISVPSATEVGDTGIDVKGADIAFDADGTLYLYSTDQNYLYTVDTETGTAIEVGYTGVKITGLAIRDGGLGDLVGSNTGNDEIITINKTDGSQGDKYSMMMNGESFNHVWGDMTVGELREQIYRDETAWADGDRFTERGNWGTYFRYEIQPWPCMTEEGSLTVTGTGWKAESAWCPCDYTYDFTEGDDPVALMGFVDVSEAAVADEGGWSKYYAMFSMHDNSGNEIKVTFGNDWLGRWYEMDAQPWDRIRMENNMGLAQPYQYYATEGGTLGYDMDGSWVGDGNGATVYPSDQNYFFQLIADPDATTFTLQVYGMGSSAPANPPDAWPKQNMFDEPMWLELGTVTVGDSFDFTEVTPCAELWASTQAGEDETTTISWEGMQIGTPVTFGETP